MNGLTEVWGAEFSDIQNCFNVTTLKDAIQKNADMVHDKNNNGYLIFGTYPTIEQAKQACFRMKQKHERSV